MTQEAFKWPAGTRCAVTLTYDDGLAVHHQYVGPTLSARGLLATFYVLINNDPLNNFEAWRSLALQGHELGNHTLFHPCRKEPVENYPWLDNGFDLRDYTPYRFQQELRVANLFLHLMDGKDRRTYGATCCDTFIGRGNNRMSMQNLLREQFVGARTRQIDQMITVSRDLNLMDIGHTRADFKLFPELRREISAVKEAGGWIVYHVHGVGAKTKELYIERTEHEALLDYLAGDGAIWVAPLIVVVDWIKQWQDA
jgi:sialate O-acetylesterase